MSKNIEGIKIKKSLSVSKKPVVDFFSGFKNFFKKKPKPKKESKEEKKYFLIRSKKKNERTSILFLRFSVKDQMHFVKRMSFLVYSGVPILECLHIVRKQNRSRRKDKVYDYLIKDVANGKPLSFALSRFDKVFNNFTIGVIKVGELSGNLSKNLTYLAEELGKKQALRRKVISALVYPAFITITSISLVTLLVVYIFPKIMPIFFSLNAELPLTTRALLVTSNFLQDYGWYLILGVIVFAVLFYFTYKLVPGFKFFVATVILKLPIIGRLVKNYNMTDFCRTFGLLLKSGFSVVDSAEILLDSTNNVVYRNEYRKLGKHIMAGKRIATHLEKKPKLFPDMISHMIMIGETSGDLPGTLVYLSEYYESEVDEQIKHLSNSIEPVLMIFMGVIVGFIAVSVITPIYQITQSLSR